MQDLHDREHITHFSNKVSLTRHFWCRVGHWNGYDLPDSGVRRVSLSFFFLASPTWLRVAFHHTTLFIVSFFCIAFHLLLLRLCVLQISFCLSVFFLCLLIFFVFSLFNFLVCVPHMTWSVLNTEWSEGLKD